MICNIPLQFTSSETEAKQYAMRYKVEYEWYYFPKYTQGKDYFYVYDEKDGMTCINYWNKLTELWLYTLVKIVRIQR